MLNDVVNASGELADIFGIDSREHTNAELVTSCLLYTSDAADE